MESIDNTYAGGGIQVTDAPLGDRVMGSSRAATPASQPSPRSVSREQNAGPVKHHTGQNHHHDEKCISRHTAVVEFAAGLHVRLLCSVVFPFKVGLSHLLGVTVQLL